MNEKIEREKIWLGFETLEDFTLPLSWKKGAYGSLLEFRGCVRNENEGKLVQAIEYEAHSELALKILKEIRDQSLLDFPDISEILIYHRLGKLVLGETSLYVAIGSAHRKNAFDVCQNIISEIKKRVPIWKKEVYQNENTLWLKGNSLKEGRL